MKSAVTISLVPEARGGPFVFWEGLESSCAKAAELGFDAVEIFPPSAEGLDCAHIQSLMAKHNLKVAAIGTGAGWLKHKLRLTDPDASLRKHAREFISRIIEAAASLGAPAIVGSMQGGSGEGSTLSQSLSWLAEALEELAEVSNRHHQILLYEPLNRYETNLFNRQEDAAEFLQSLRPKNIRLLCDLFHMNIEESSIAEALLVVGPSIGHVHFADSNRQAVGFGHTDITPVMSALQDIGFAGYLSAEILPVPDSRSAAVQTIHIFRKYKTL